MCDDAITINRVNTNAHILHLNLNLKQTIALINFWKNVNVNFKKKNVYIFSKHVYNFIYSMYTIIKLVQNFVYSTIQFFNQKIKIKKTHTHTIL